MLNYLLIIFCAFNLKANARVIEKIPALHGLITPKIKVSLPDVVNSPLPAVVIVTRFGELEFIFSEINLPENLIFVGIEAPSLLFDGKSYFTSFDKLKKMKMSFLNIDEQIDITMQKLRTDRRVDNQRISIMGFNEGNLFVLNAMTRNIDLANIMILQGFGKVADVIKVQLENVDSWNPFKWLVAKFIWYYLGYPSPEESIRKAQPRLKMLYLSNENDVRVPLHAIQSLKDAIKGSSARVTLISYPQNVAEVTVTEKMFHSALEWLKNSGGI